MDRGAASWGRSRYYHILHYKQFSLQWHQKTSYRLGIWDDNIIISCVVDIIYTIYIVCIHMYVHVCISGIHGIGQYMKDVCMLPEARYTMSF